MTCFAILATALIRSCQISIYHLNMICNLAWFSTITHLLSIIVLRHYWLERNKKLALYVRTALMICALIMLLYVDATLLKSVGSSSACPAICAFSNPGPWKPFRPINIFRLSLALGADMCILCWIYPTTGLFVFPLWYKFYHFIVWKLPSRFLKSLRRFGLSVIGIRCIRITVDRQIQGICDAYRQIFFPSQRLAIVCQVMLWCLRFVILIMDRWASPISMSDPGAENQWGFGQLLAVIIVFLPLLTLLETWSGELSHFEIWYLPTLLT